MPCQANDPGDPDGTAFGTDPLVAGSLIEDGSLRSSSGRPFCAPRTPITIARGHLDLIAAGATDPTTIEDIAVVTEQLDRMATLSSTLLALEEIESIPGDARSEVDVGGLLVELHRRWSRSVDRTWHLAVVEPLYAVVDGHRVEMALDAVIDNAIKHTQPWGRIRLSAASSGGWVTLGVDDDGPGVPERERELVFRRFAKGDNAPPGKGSGLGLALVRAVARAHGGDVRIEQSWLGGAAIRMVLPTVVPEDEQAAEPVPTYEI